VAGCFGCRKPTWLDLARPMGQRQAGDRHRQAQVLLAGDLTAVGGKCAVRARLNGTGSAIGRADGHPGADTLARAQRQAVQAGWTQGTGEWAKARRGPGTGQGAGTGVNDRVRSRAEPAVRSKLAMPNRLRSRATTVTAVSRTCR